MGRGEGSSGLLGLQHACSRASSSLSCVFVVVESSNTLQHQLLGLVLWTEPFRTGLTSCCALAVLLCPGAAGNCKPVTCSQAIKQYCPATPPMGPEVATAADLTGWTSRDCLWALCYSRADQVNLTRCVFDETNDLTYLSYSYGALNGSSVFTTMLASMNTTVQPLPVDGPGEW